MMASAAVGVPTMALPELLDIRNASDADTMISGLQLDSRKVRPGDLFLALPGDVHDGRQFIEQAVANGAAAVAAEAPVAGFLDAITVPLVELPDLRFELGALAARFYRNPSSQQHVTGVTGTNGKTTTSRIIGQLTRALGKPCGVIGTLGASLCDDMAAARNTTPDAISLQQQLSDWLQQGVLAVTMEVSSHALAQGRVNGLCFETAVYTNLSHDHLDYHGSMEAYGRAKLQLFTNEHLRHAIINADDAFSPRVRDAVVQEAEVLTYSICGAAADVRVENAHFGVDGVHGEFHTPWGQAEFSSPLAGDFNLANMAAAVTALVVSGEDLGAVLQSVVELNAVPGRMETVPNRQGLQVVVDYAHTPQALEHVLQALRSQTDGELVCVFGCGGDRDEEKRQLMGRVACRLADRVIVTSDNPRSEAPGQIMAHIETGCSGDYTLVEDRGQAIAMAIADAASGDCILIAGKGHEEYQQLDERRIYFSDVAEASKALAGRSSK